MASSSVAGSDSPLSELKHPDKRLVAAKRAAIGVRRWSFIFVSPILRWRQGSVLGCGPGTSANEGRQDGFDDLYHQPRRHDVGGADPQDVASL